MLLCCFIIDANCIVMIRESKSAASVACFVENLNNYKCYFVFRYKFCFNSAFIIEIKYSKSREFPCRRFALPSNRDRVVMPMGLQHHYALPLAWSPPANSVQLQLYIPIH